VVGDRNADHGACRHREKSVVQNFVVTEAKDVRDEVTMPQVRPHCGATIAASAAAHRLRGESLRA